MTKQEACKTIAGSEELRSKYENVKNDDELRAFLSEIGYTGDLKEFIEYVSSMAEGEIDDKNLEDVAGGRWLHYPRVIDGKLYC